MVDGQPLLAQYTVQFVPSLYSAYTAQQRLAGNSGKRLLAVINPTENLDYASIEGELVSYFFANQTMLLGLDASAAKFNHALTGKPTYLHMSTHGSYQWLNPLESGLELAQGERLTLGNLLSKSDMLADNRLVVLSACETGLTDINAPAEALGLPAAFLQAGAPGVISTLWTVNEQSTTFLLGKFYQLHRRQNIEPPKALAQAQEWLRTATYQDLRDWLRTHMTEKTSPQFLPMMQMLEEFRSMATQEADNRPYQDPYYWAGFVYSGM